MKYLNFGIRIATKSPHNFRHSSIIIRGGKILSYGHNHNSIHAEVNALNDVWSNKLLNAYIINFRINREGELRNSFPCDNCVTYAKNKGIRKIVFSTENGFKEIKL
jgi:deoxycytidylate deaminase